MCVCIESKTVPPLMNKPIQFLSVFPQQRSGGAGMAHVSETHSGLRDKSSPGIKDPKEQTQHTTPPTFSTSFPNVSHPGISIPRHLHILKHFVLYFFSFLPYTCYFLTAHFSNPQFSLVQWLSHVRLFATP